MKLKIKIRKFKTGSYEIKMNKLIETEKENDYLLKKIKKMKDEKKIRRHYSCDKPTEWRSENE